MIVSGAIWGTALAAIPDASGVIHGCYKPSDGKLRVIDTEAGKTCASEETALVWNQTGPQGSVGPSGSQVRQVSPPISMLGRVTFSHVQADLKSGLLAVMRAMSR
jgi:hypothetical protein